MRSLLDSGRVLYIFPTRVKFLLSRQLFTLTTFHSHVNFLLSQLFTLTSTFYSRNPVMNSLSASEAVVCSSNPINDNDGLDAFRASFLSEVKAADPKTFKQVVSSLPTDEGINTQGIRWAFAD